MSSESGLARHSSKYRIGILGVAPRMHGRHLAYSPLDRCLHFARQPRQPGLLISHRLRISPRAGLQLVHLSDRLPNRRGVFFLPERLIDDEAGA